MPRKTFGLIIALTIITFLLFYFAVKKDNQIKINSQKAALSLPTPTPVQELTEIYFDPAQIDVSAKTTSSTSSALFINTNSNTVSSVQIEISFDPIAFSNIDINPPIDTSFFGEKGNYNILLKNIDYKNGRISYAVSLNKNETAKSGIGKIAVLSFTTNPNVNQTNTKIKLLNKTTVNQPEVGPSVLRNLSELSLDFIPKTVSSSSSGRICAQVITYAKNPTTGRCIGFPTPCDIPQGWGSCSINTPTK